MEREIYEDYFFSVIYMSHICQIFLSKVIWRDFLEFRLRLKQSQIYVVSKSLFCIQPKKEVLYFVEGDSLEVIEVLNAFPVRKDWRIPNTIKEIHGVFQQLDHWKWQHTKKCANNVEHCLARWVTIEFISWDSPYVIEQNDMNGLYARVNPLMTRQQGCSPVGTIHYSLSLRSRVRIWI